MHAGYTTVMCADSAISKRDGWSAVHAPEEVARAVDRLAAFASAPSEIAARERFIERLELHSGARVLDVGAGSGSLTLDLAARVAPDGKVVAIDPSAELLAAAAGMGAPCARGAGRRAMRTGAGRGGGGGPLAAARAAGAGGIPFGDDAFHPALCPWVLLHAARPQRARSEEHS